MCLMRHADTWFGAGTLPIGLLTRQAGLICGLVPEDADRPMGRWTNFKPVDIQQVRIVAERLPKRGHLCLVHFGRVASSGRDYIVHLDIPSSYAKINQTSPIRRQVEAQPRLTAAAQIPARGPCCSRV